MVHNEDRQIKKKKNGESNDTLMTCWNEQFNEKEKRIQCHSKTRSTGGLRRSTHAQGRFDQGSVAPEHH